MTENYKNVSSKQAVQAFKKEMENCLSLVGFLDSEEDKEDIWKFWKTTTSAIKIALNRKGDAISFPFLSRTRNQDANSSNSKEILLNIPSEDTTVFVSLGNNDKGQKQCRAVKFENQEMTDDSIGVNSNVNYEADSTRTNECSEANSKQLQKVQAEMGRENCLLGVASNTHDNNVDASYKNIPFENNNDSQVYTSSSSNSNSVNSDCFYKIIPNTSSNISLTATSPVNENLEKEDIDQSHSQATKRQNVKVTKPTSFEKPATRMSCRVREKKSVLNLIPVKMREDRISFRSYKRNDNFDVNVDGILDVREEKVESFLMPQNSSAEGRMETCDIQSSAIVDQVKDNSNSNKISRILHQNKMESSLSHNSSCELTAETVVHVKTKDMSQDVNIIPHSEIKQETIVNCDNGNNNSNSDSSVKNNSISTETEIGSNSGMNYPLTLTQDTGTVIIGSEAIQIQPLEVRVKMDNSIVESANKEYVEEGISNDETIDHTYLGTDSTSPHKQQHKSPSDIETIISALEEELKKTGSTDGIHSISITSGDDCTTSGTLNIYTSTTTPKESDDIQQMIQNETKEGIMTVQNVEDIIWNPSDGSAHVLETAGNCNPTTTLIDGVDETHTQTLTVTTVTGDDNIDDNTMVHQSMDAQYDVVEYEVLAENTIPRRSGGGARKRKRDKDLLQPQHHQEVDVKSNTKDELDRTCPMCHRVLTYPSSMAAHMRIHTGDRPYICGQCDRKFTTKANRDRHEATHVGLKPFKCAECDKCFTEKRSLKIHTRSHTGEKPFVCPVCDRGFAQKCTLVVHMDRHTNKKGHLCDLCGKAFRQKCQLDIHVKRHNRQANYPCPDCSVKCYTKGDLVRHMIKHTGERPFSCLICSKTFTRKQYLVDHENAHYGRKPYKCSVCAMAFHDMGSCHRHVKKHREQDEALGTNENSLKQEPATILTADDYETIVKSSQAGKILTLEDGTQALVTAVDTEADGVTVYHVTCVGDQQQQDDENKTMTTSSTTTTTKEEILDSITTTATDASTIQDIKHDLPLS